jgi:hypothetical protein
MTDLQCLMQDPGFFEPFDLWILFELPFEPFFVFYLALFHLQYHPCHHQLSCQIFVSYLVGDVMKVLVGVSSANSLQHYLMTFWELLEVAEVVRVLQCLVGFGAVFELLALFSNPYLAIHEPFL